jgi:putative phage-type endonuclease
LSNEERKLIWTEEELPQGSQEWLDWREGGNEEGIFTIGGSETAALMYMSPFGVPLDLYNLKKGLATKDFSELQMEIMDRGTRLEPLARRHYENKFGVSVNQLCAVHPRYPWMRTSLDGLTEDGKVILEIKSPKNLANHTKQTKNGIVPAYRYPQMQWQIAVMREHFPQVERVDYVSFYAEETEDGSIINAEMVVIPIYANDEFIAEMIRRAEIFIEHLKNETPPEPTLFTRREELIAVNPRRIKPASPYTIGYII